jgi:hypothetical protein
MTRPPDDHSDLDARLRGVRFQPRESFEPELLGRLQRREPPAVPAGWSPARAALAGAALAACLALGFFALRGVIPRGDPVTIDRCCYDLDGGGAADDGVLIFAERDARVHRLRLYEDRDGSGALSQGDVVRLDRGGELALESPTGDGLVTVAHCCLDFDGGGPPDDGLVVIGVPPDRVVMAAIYEHRSRRFPLR